MSDELGRCFNEVYCNVAYVMEVEDELMKLHRRLQEEHPEWGMDFSPGGGNWELVDEDGATTGETI